MARSTRVSRSDRICDTVSPAAIRNSASKASTGRAACSASRPASSVIWRTAGISSGGSPTRTRSTSDTAANSGVGVAGVASVGADGGAGASAMPSTSSRFTTCIAPVTGLTLSLRRSAQR